ncbi:unnamed protein product [Dovyalis caffra]|uniref:Uncharacterized protein n=1 Tax=Dovyalis caffra TaxID=77055 RepID=A0AAV1SQJ4_9ROSI|nr:unnamed protein product [Dovyalis caffra]
MHSSEKLDLIRTRKWQNLAAVRRKGITPRRAFFVAYSADQKRFLLPSDYLKIVRALLKLAEEELWIVQQWAFQVALIKQPVTRDACCLCLAVAAKHLQNSIIQYKTINYRFSLLKYRRKLKIYDIHNFFDKVCSMKTQREISRNLQFKDMRKLETLASVASS